VVSCWLWNISLCNHNCRNSIICCLDKEANALTSRIIMSIESSVYWMTVLISVRVGCFFVANELMSQYVRSEGT
jgi:hypothetical protein